MIGLALSGGGSRAIAFHLGCLRALHDLDILGKVKVISSISGGSVIGAYYAYTPSKSFEEFDLAIQEMLKQGFQKQIAIELLKPRNLMRTSANYLNVKARNFSAMLFRSAKDTMRYPTRTDMFHEHLRKSVYGDIRLTSSHRRNLDIVIGATELRTGSAFRFGNQKSGSWRYGELTNPEIDVSLAVATSAAYPLLLPSIEREWKFSKGGEVKEHRIILTDGGVYDNLGTQVLEPGRDTKISLHSYDVESLIVCNAGAGLDGGLAYPQGYFSRVSKSFEIIHRRVQDASMNRLHALHKEGKLKRFIMPYLGQQDSQLPYRPTDLVARHDVAEYPTNFAPMSEEWIGRLTKRGEQLTRLLASLYLY